MPDSRLVSVLLTDIEGSTRLWEDHGDAMGVVLAEHDRLLREAINAHEGTVFSTAGDSFAAEFPTAEAAVASAVDAQLATRSLVVEGEPVRVRMAVHSGEVEERDDGYFGAALNRCGRLRDAAHGGQVLVSLTAEELLGGRLPKGVSLQDLGEHRLRDLSRPQRVFQLNHPDLEAEFPPLRSLGGVSAALPVQVTSFVGRVQESADLESLLSSSRLVTVTGPGGCGKSRMALQVAADILNEFPDGARLVELARLTDPELIASTVATAVGVREHASLTILDALVGYLRSRRLLLILDNCEHLIESAADLTAHLLSRTPEIRVIATSREPLHIHGETVYRLPTLPVPAPHSDLGQVLRSDAVQLFTDRAEAANPGFLVTHENAAAVASICNHLDGIPLAVELAASASRMLSPHQINKRLTNEIQILSGGARDDVDHHRSLEIAIDWSYQLLTPDQRNAFVRLGVFAGVFSIGAAEAVCADGDDISVSILDQIVQLGDRSLLEVDETTAEIRYRMLETIRAFATARLQELPDNTQQVLAERHCRYFLSLAEEATEGPISAHTPWLAELDAATPDLRQALTWAVESHHHQYAVDLAGALGWYWWVRHQREEAVHWFQSIPLNSTEVTDRSRTRALGQAAFHLGGTGVADATDISTAREMAEESLRLARQTGDPGLIAASLVGRGGIGVQTADPQALSDLEEGLAIAQAAGDSWRQADIRNFMAHHFWNVGELETATALFEENLHVARELSDARMIGLTLGFLGHMANDRGDFDTACRLGEESLAIGHELDSYAVTANALDLLGDANYRNGDLDIARRFMEEQADLEWRTTGDEVSLAFVTLGFVGFAQGDLAAARRYFGRALTRLRDAGYSSDGVFAMRRTLWGFTLVLARQHTPNAAARLLAAVEATAELTPPPSRPPWIAHEHRQYLQLKANLEATLIPDDLQHAQEQGSAMTLDQAINYTLGFLEERAQPFAAE